LQSWISLLLKVAYNPHIFMESELVDFFAFINRVQMVRVFGVCNITLSVKFEIFLHWHSIIHLFKLIKPGETLDVVVRPFFARKEFYKVM